MTSLTEMDRLSADHEVHRSKALRSYGVLDTPKEGEFDDIARLASEICETPIAIVNLVDTARQFFKAEVGLGIRETPLETPFCGHAILTDDFMMVPDAAKDPRFAGNPLITGEPGLRFYAGALLKTADGLPIGTVCVLDTRPRDLDKHQIYTLKLLARQAMTQLELRKALTEQGTQASRNRKILDSALDFAIVVTDPGGMVTEWNKGARRSSAGPRRRCWVPRQTATSPGKTCSKAVSAARWQARCATGAPPTNGGTCARTDRASGRVAR
jgi:hypothetical protein